MTEPTTDIAVREPAPTLSLPDHNEWARIKDVATELANSSIVPKAYRGRPHDILAAALVGRELGFSPMAAMQRIHVIEGKPTLSAEAMVALVQRADHEIWVDPASNAEQAKVYGQRRGSDRVHELVFTMAEARAAGVTGKDNWKKYPKAMLRARAISALCRIAFADVLAGYTYTPDEIEDGDVIEAEVVQSADAYCSLCEQLVAEGDGDPCARCDWVATAVKTYGEAAVVEAAESVRSDLKVGAPITGLKGVAKAKGDPQRRIIDLLARDYDSLQNVSTRSDEDGEVIDAEVVEPENPCPLCGSECERRTKKKGNKTTRWWTCTNPECESDGFGGQPWTSFHNDPWKPGGEIETELKRPDLVREVGQRTVTGSAPLKGEESEGVKPPQARPVTRETPVEEGQGDEQANAGGPSVGTPSLLDGQQEAPTE